MKKTLVLGASPNPNRYSYTAVRRLLQNGHEVVPVGIKPGKIDDTEILTELTDIEGIDTVTLYINPRIQPQYYDYILNLKPKRILFNPGTENRAFMELAKEAGIEVEAACTLVLLSIGNY